MSSNTLTFAMGGRVEIDQFQRGITQLQRLVSALSADPSVKWVIEDLHPGSAVVTLRGECEDPAEVEKAIHNYDRIGAALELDEPLDQGEQVNRVINTIRSLAKSVEFIRLETLAGDHVVRGDGKPLQQRTPPIGIGAISGRIQTLTNRRSLRFNLYDTVHDKAVACYLQAGQEELMREAWGRLARVSGAVSREPNTGWPVAIRQILHIDLLEETTPGSYRLARGAVSWQQGDKMPEDVIRQLRDA